MDVLLTSPNLRESLMSLIGVKIPNVGLGILAAVLEEEGFRVAIKHTTDINDFRNALRKNSPNVLGVSCMTCTYPMARQMAAAAKAYHKDIMVVLGGPHVTFLDKETLLETPEIDVVVRGEGERSFLNLTKHYVRGEPRLREIPNITYWHKGEIRRNPKETPLSNLDELPFQAYHLYDIGRRLRSGMYGVKAAVLVTSRGCPYNCTFCASSAMYGHIWRARSAESIVDEIEYLKERFNVQLFAMADDNFCVSPRRIAKFCNELRERNVRIRYTALARADFVCNHPKLLKEMVKTGLQCITFGVETGSQQVLNKYGKKQKLRAVEEAFRTAKKYEKKGLVTIGTFMIGSDWDTIESTKETIDFAKHLNPHVAQITIFTPLPGTRDYDRIEFEGRLLTRDWSKYDCEHIVYEPKNMSPQQVAYWHNRAIREFYGRTGYWLQNMKFPNFVLIPNLIYWLLRRDKEAGPTVTIRSGKKLKASVKNEYGTVK